MHHNELDADERHQSQVLGDDGGLGRIIESLAPDLHDHGLAPVSANVRKRLGEHARFGERTNHVVTSAFSVTYSSDRSAVRISAVASP